MATNLYKFIPQIKLEIELVDLPLHPPYSPMCRYSLVLII